MRPLHYIAAPVLLACLTLGPRAAHAQISLGEAMARADSSAFANRIAEASAAARAADALRPARGILPSVRVDASMMRTTDPIGAFGTKLRQRDIAPADFDPARLNRPEPIGNVATALVLDQPLLNTDAWLGRAAAHDAADAEQAMADWTRLSLRVDVVRAYFGATLAEEKHAMLEDAERAAMAHVARARALADTGLVTRSDALLAEVRAGDVRAQRLAAAADASHAARALAVLLGAPGAPVVARTRIPDAAVLMPLVAPDTVERPNGARADVRADVRAATLAESAARGDLRRSRAQLLPRLNGFARLDWNDRNVPFANDHNWTAGVMASWTPFSGASELADSRATAARARAATAQRLGATAAADLESARTRDALVVALEQVTLAERAAEQSTEALRIVARKYDGGLATISELLEAQAIATQSRLGFAHARYRLITAAAERRHALGGDPAYLTALDGATPNRDAASR